MWPSRSARFNKPTPTRVEPASLESWDAKPSEGGFQAMDQMANWVRFADTKATILTAGLGVILTMLMNNAKTVTTAFSQGCVQALVMGILALGALGAFLYTLFWLVWAIGPQTSTKYSRLNRFAWPSLRQATAEQLAEHADQVDVRQDAWQQVIELSELAGRKFDACAKAVKGFALLAVLGLSCVVVALGLTR